VSEADEGLALRAATPEEAAARSLRMSFTMHGIGAADGIAIGPAGIGWWTLAAAAAVTGVSLWAVLPLHERVGTALWLAAAWLAWAGAAASAWMGRTDALRVVGAAAWSAGAALALIAMLTAARSVIREVRGEAGKRAAAPSRQDSRATTMEHREPDRAEPVGRSFGDAVGSDTEFTDGSDDDLAMRHLSKAERKRLRKQARLQRAG